MSARERERECVSQGPASGLKPLHVFRLSAGLSHFALGEKQTSPLNAISDLSKIICADYRQTRLTRKIRGRVVLPGSSTEILSAC